jgi:hypothetical protein
MKLSQPGRLRTEDVPEESRPLMDKIAPGINDLQDELVRILNGNVDFENLNRQKTQFEINTDASGNIIAAIPIKLNLRSKPYGVNIVRIENVNNPGTYPAYLPLVVFNFNETILTISAIKGLTASAKYRLYLEIIGT